MKMARKEDIELRRPYTRELKALVGCLENALFGNENKSACRCTALAMVA